MQPIPHLIIVGRDGILNEFRTDHIKAPEEWLPVPGALEALCRLNHAGWHALVKGASQDGALDAFLLDRAQQIDVFEPGHAARPRAGPGAGACERAGGMVSAAAAGCEPHLVRSGRAASLSAAEVADMVRQVPGTVVHRDLGELATHLLERAHLRDSQSGALD